MVFLTTVRSKQQKLRNFKENSPMTKSIAKPIRVADYLAQQIRLCGKSQKQIAEEVGYDKANVVTMMKQGLTKIPITRVGAFARALEVDPAHLLRLVLAEYSPETWAAIEEAINGTVLTRNERRLVEKYRVASGNTDPVPSVRVEGDVTVIAIKTPAVAFAASSTSPGELSIPDRAAASPAEVAVTNLADGV
jgi:hypothetical protein